jgi:hypothetical protein
VVAVHRLQPLAEEHLVDLVDGAIVGDLELIVPRITMTVHTPKARLAADIGVAYTFSEPLAVPQEIVAEFVEKVAVMAVFPFLRESVFTTATRLGVAPPVIGLLRAGDFHVEAPAATDPPNA